MSIDIFPIPLIKKSKYISFLILLFIPYAIFSITVSFPEEAQTSAVQITDHICKEEFKLAEDAARKIIRKYPDSPSGYFFWAVVLDSWMSYYQNNRKEDEFYRNCDLAVEKSEKILSKKADDEWAMFFMGGAEGYKGTYEVRYGRWITAFRYGWRGVSILMKLAERKSEIADINYGIGAYEYWRSAMIKTLWWMPNVKDRREEGIKKLYLALNQGTYTRVASAAQLIEILINENRIEEVIPVVDKMLRHYPSSSMFLWGKARALYGLGRFDEAEQIFSYMLKKYESDEINNHINSALCHYWLARIDFAQNRFKETLEHIDYMDSYTFDEDTKKLLEKYYSESRSMKRNSESKLNKNSQ